MKNPVHFVIAELYTKSCNSNTSSTITEHSLQHRNNKDKKNHGA